jgi:hypothetical protein
MHVCMYALLYVSINVCIIVCTFMYVLVDCRQSADSRLRGTTRTNCHIYTLLPPDDGLLSSPKHLQI